MKPNYKSHKPDTIIKHFTKCFSKQLIESVLYRNAEAYFADHMHLVTMQVDRKSQRPITQPLEVFGKWYFKLVRKLLKKNVGSQIDKQPLSYVFVDCEGSRSGAHTLSAPHVHAVM